jgi:hypothetical protein
MVEGMPPTPQEMKQLSRDLMEKVLDKAGSDPAWRQQLLDDPEAALRTANFPEAQQIQQIRQKEAAEEVRGQQRFVDSYDLSGSSIDAPPSPMTGGRPPGWNPCGQYYTCHVYSF